MMSETLQTNNIPVGPVGRPKGRLDSKPRKKKITAAQRSAAARKAAETRRLRNEEKIAGLQTGSQVKPANAEFEELLDQVQPKKEVKKDDILSSMQGHADHGPSEALSPSDISEWIGWPFMIWASHNDLADLCLSDEEKNSLAEPLCKIANRHHIDQYVNPDILDGITAAGRLSPIMFKRFAVIAAERKRRAAQGSAAVSTPDTAGEGSPADVTT